MILKAVLFPCIIAVLSATQLMCCGAPEEPPANLRPFTTEINDSLLLPYAVTINDSAKTRGYYFLFTYKMNKNNPLKKGWQQVIDGNGYTVFFRRMEKGSDFKVHPDGRMSYFGGTKFIIMDSQFRIVDSVGTVNGVEIDNHDFLILPNGNYVLIGTESFKMDLGRYNIFMRKNLPGSKKAKVKYGVVQELDKNKKLVHEWHARPYFRMEDASQVYLNDSVNMDITHFNSIDVDEQGNYIISARYSNEIIKVNKSDGTVAWRLGGKNNTFQFINNNAPFLGQHDARLLPNGHLLLFDNGYGEEAEQHNAAALEYELDETAKTARLVWAYGYPEKIISEATGNARRSANGTTLINFGKIKNGTPNVTMLLVNENKQELFKLVFRDTIGSYRGYYYPSLPFHLDRPGVNVTAENGGWKLTATGGYPSYQWSDGTKGQTLQVKKPGTYYVFVPYGEGFISSEPVTISQ